MMDFFAAMDILASGLGAERLRMNVSASNLANAETTRTPGGGPYRRRDAVFVPAAVDEGNPFTGEISEALRAVEVAGVVTDSAPPRRVYDPDHPDAGPDGYVAMPNVNLVEEMVDMVTASRAYEAGVNAMNSVVEMARRALTLGK